jgi:hypothetical protein
MNTKLSLQECDIKVQALFVEADKLSDQYYRNHPNREFDRFVPANYPLVYAELRKLKDTAITFLEMGSGLGVVTIMADFLGFEAYGIEICPELTDTSQDLAEAFQSKAIFANGSFLPDDFQWNPEHFSDDLRTEPDGVPAYDELDMDLPSFDLLYAFPGPYETLFFRDLLRQSGRHGSLFLTDNGIEGIDLWTVGSQIQ